MSLKDEMKKKCESEGGRWVDDVNAVCIMNEKTEDLAEKARNLQKVCGDNNGIFEIKKVDENVALMCKIKKWFSKDAVLNAMGI